NMKFLKNRKFIIGSLLLVLFISTNVVISSFGPSEKFSDELSYRSSLGQCPNRPAGNMALSVMETFEQTGSLRDVKKKIVQEKWNEKYFVSDYKISYDPYSKILNLNFECPKPLMKVQIYKANGIDSYEAVLVDNGELYDPTYEVLLRSENKLTGNLPYLALPVGEMENKTQVEITQLVKSLREELRKKLSEIILNDQKELTVILSINGYPSSVFLGLDEWSEKITKLDKIVNFLETKEKIPAVINLTNSKKVVVKFRE
ncbi:MAG: cell division protein FtsQ, partial [Bacteriovoracaceae bacterium]|nr:cell division protein FtsQ [Bacteriovoracaceae bacterium]